MEQMPYFSFHHLNHLGPGIGCEIKTWSCFLMLIESTTQPSIIFCFSQNNWDVTAKLTTYYVLHLGMGPQILINSIPLSINFIDSSYRLIQVDREHSTMRG